MPEPYLQPPAQDQIPLPSPTILTLPTEINNATRYDAHAHEYSDQNPDSDRSLHTELNSLITGRLLLALPPNASDPTLYATGISIFARIYIAFEQAHTDLIDAVLSTQTSDPADPHEAHQLAVRTCLSTLTPPGLWRTKRLEDDLRVLKVQMCLDTEAARAPCRPVSDLIAHIRSTVGTTPHVLIAYQWVMYMAIFSGGRWIRQRLRDAGPEFWNRSLGDQSQTCEDRLGFSVFEFDGTNDGEDIKSDFKTRLSAVERLFTERERSEVVEESKRLFQACIDTVHDLDDKTQSLLRDSNAPGAQSQPGNLVSRYDQASLSGRSNTALLVAFTACVIWYVLRAMGAF